MPGSVAFRKVLLCKVSYSLVFLEYCIISKLADSNDYENYACPEEESKCARLFLRFHNLGENCHEHANQDICPARNCLQSITSFNFYELCVAYCFNIFWKIIYTNDDSLIVMEDFNPLKKKKKENDSDLFKELDVDLDSDHPVHEEFVDEKGIREMKKKRVFKE